MANHHQEGSCSQIPQVHWPGSTQHLISITNDGCPKWAVAFLQKSLCSYWGLGDGWISVIYEIYTSMGWKLGGLAIRTL
jgi:hypothetical protein